MSHAIIAHKQGAAKSQETEIGNVYGRSLLILFAIAFWSGLSLSASAAPAQTAQGIIERYCTQCHRVPGFAEEAPNPTIRAPDFQFIADNPTTYTTARLVAFMRKPHFPMRGLVLSESDIQRLIGFIEGLRAGPATVQ